MNVKGVMLIAAGTLICGVLLDRYAMPFAVREKQVAHEVHSDKREARSHGKSAEVEVARLRSRVKELERMLGERDAEGDDEEAGRDSVQEEKAEPIRPEPVSFRARLEEMRVNDPAKYAQMTNDIAIRRANYIQRVQDRLDLLAAMDTSRMTPKQRENHLRYQELVARQTELGDMLRPGSAELSDEERDNVRSQLHGINRELGQLSRVERDTLLRQAALGFGLKGRTNAEAVETIKAVIQATDGGWPGGPFHHGGRGGHGWRR